MGFECIHGVNSRSFSTLFLAGDKKDVDFNDDDTSSDVREVGGLIIAISGKFDASLELGKQCLDYTWIVIRGHPFAPDWIQVGCHQSPCRYPIYG